MIGKIIIGKSFRGCISYCLEDKPENNISQQRVNGRAEVLGYNLCFGNKLELVKQFNEVRNLNPKLSKPVMHITLSLAPGERLDNNKLATIADDCAREMGFEKNQYLAVAHSDTKHQHLHIVVNRICFNGKTISDSHNYQRIAIFCRKMEEKYKLQQVLNPKRFLPKELRHIHRSDSRKERLKNDIHNTLKSCTDYRQFEEAMKQMGYQVLKARGIAFIDPQKVRTKGSEVGYSLSKIEKLLSLPVDKKNEIVFKGRWKEFQSKNRSNSLEKKTNQHPKIDREKEQSLFDLLMKPKEQSDNMQSLLPKKRRKKKRSQHL
jgi:hypothetical protein